MRFSFGDAMCDPAHYVPLAKAADELGFHTFPIGDSICYPEVAVGEYPYLESGELRAVLTDYEDRRNGIYAVYPQKRYLQAKVRSFVDFLVERFGPTPPWERPDPASKG